MKLYQADVSINVTLFVVADSEEDAHETALNSVYEELENGNNSDSLSAAIFHLDTCPKSARGSLPWGGDGDRPCEDYFGGDA